MPVVIDPEGAHLASLLRLADFRDRRVLEIGCGDGRLTRGFAAVAHSVLAIDPSAEAIAAADAGERARDVRFEAVSAAEAEIPRGAFDLVVFSWSY